MATINSSDILFATVSRQGSTLASMRISGMTSLAEIIRYIRKTLDGVAGLLSLNLRNSSQGWQQQRTILLPA